MKKGITPVIAVILLLLLTISIIGFAFIYFSRIGTQAGAAVESEALSTIKQGSVKFSIEAVSMDSITIRNRGNSDLNTSTLSIFIDDENLQPSVTPTIPPGQTGTIKMNENVVGKTLKVSGGLSQDVRQIDDVLVYFLDEYEYFSNGNRCTDDMYVIENNKIQFFVSTVRTYDPVTTNNCGSGVESYDDRYAGLPMRIWAKGTESSSYKVNTVVIDDTLFYAPSATTVSDSKMFTVLENGLRIDFDQQGDIQPSVTYTLDHDKNYVKVELSAKYVGSSSQSVRLRWEGDQDGAGTCRFQSGFQAACTTSRIDAGEKWLAEWTGNNDVMGYITPDSNTEIDMPWAWEGVRVEETTSTTLQPEEIHTFTFYIVADAKGSPEWQPIEDTYNEIIS